MPKKKSKPKTTKKKKSEKFQTPTGMHDILPRQQHMWQYFYRVAEEFAEFYSFGKIDTPVLEPTELFEKGTGTGTDIVEKEMFSLRTKGGDKLTLRPEGTPPIVRAYIQHGMKKWTSPAKLYYFGSMFRHEKPQRGRFRQFHQFGLETIGEDEPARDAEIIQVMILILDRLRLKDITVEVNSIGCNVCRPKYIKNLKEHYRYKLKKVCKDCRQRYKDNPLRLLDCEDEKCARIKQEAPHILDSICGDCSDHFKSVLEIMDAIEIPYLLNPYLVRGLDYYTRTVFEIFEGSVDDAAKVKEEPGEQKRIALASGGRYDRLVKQFGGKDTPAVGGAMGIERVIEVMKRDEKEPPLSGPPKLFIVQLGDKAKKKTFRLFEDFRKAGITVKEALGRDSISSQLKLANKYGVKLTIILGQKEVLDKVAIIREMDTGAQETIPEEKLVDEVKKRLKKMK